MAAASPRARAEGCSWQMGRSCSGPPSQGQTELLEGSAAGCPRAERPQPAIPSRIRGHEHPQPPVTTNDPHQQRLGHRAARPHGASPAPGHMGLIPFPGTEPCPQPSSQGSRWRPFPLPTPAARLVPRARPQRSSSYRAPTGARDWQHGGNRTTVAWEWHRWAPPRPPGPGQQPALPAFPARSVRVTMEHGEGQEPPTPATPRGGLTAPLCPRETRAPRRQTRHPSLRQTSPTPVASPRWANRQAVSSCSVRERRGGNCPDEAKPPLRGQPEGSAREKRDPLSRQDGQQAESQPQSPRGRAENPSSIRHDLIRCPLTNCTRASALGEDSEGPAKRGNEWVKKSHRRSTRQEPGTG